MARATRRRGGARRAGRERQQRGGALGHRPRRTFAGHQSVTIAPGGQVDSDPVAFDVAANQPLAVSIYIGKDQKLVAWHRVASQANYVSTPGNHADDTSADAFRTKFTQYAWLASVAVDDASAQSVVAIGDSITDGMRSTPNANRRWPDALARRLAEKGVSGDGCRERGDQRQPSAEQLALLRRGGPQPFRARRTTPAGRARQSSC